MHVSISKLDIQIMQISYEHQGTVEIRSYYLKFVLTGVKPFRCIGVPINESLLQLRMECLIVMYVQTFWYKFVILFQTFLAYE